jgi:hypothetical protein
MDPQVTWENLLDAYADRDWKAAVEHVVALLDWLQKGGFPPWTVPSRLVRAEVDRLIVVATCRLVLEEAE